MVGEPSARESIVRGYDEARRLTREQERRELSAKEYLDTVAPGTRTTKSARDYMRRMRSGERSGTTLAKRAQKDSGRTLRVEYRIGRYRDPQTGQDVDDIRSQNMTIPAHLSRLDVYRANLRETFDRGLRESWSRRQTAPQRRPDYVPLERLPEDAEFMRVYRPKSARRMGVILRVS